MSAQKIKKSKVPLVQLEDVIFYNNTSFPLQVVEALRAIEHLKDEDPARYHQRLVIDYMRKYPYSRGLLIYHKMGAGKTILGAAISEGLMEDDPSRKTIFISAKSLHDNFKKDLRKYLQLAKSNKSEDAAFSEHVTQKYKFVSMNASNMIRQVYKATQKEGLELFSDVFEKIFKPSKSPPRKKRKTEQTELPEERTTDVPDDTSDTGDTSGTDMEREAARLNIKKFKEQMDKINALESLDGVNIIIDEAHNFFNSVTNGSRNALALYYMMLYANDVKIIFLTGSPVVNDPFELAVCFNVLAGLQDGNLLFGENYNDFSGFFVDNYDLADNEAQDLKEITGIHADTRIRNPMIKNKNKFMDRIAGLVSYFGADSPEFKKLLPRPEPLQVLRIPMSQKQYSFYIMARDKEMEETKRSAGFKSAALAMQKPGGASSSYRVMSRQVSNFLFPEYASRIYRNEKGRIIYEKDINKLTDETFDIKQMKEYSTKLLTLMENLKRHLPKDALSEFKLSDADSSSRGVGPGLVYSQFVESGVNIIGKALERYGMQKINSVADLMKPISGKGTYRFAIISGETPVDLEEEIKKAYNLPENQDASIIAVLLVTVKGAEGINLFTCRHEHMYEPFWHYARVEQFFDRAIRPGSLNMLPEKERNVYRYIYLSDYPKKVEIKDAREKNGKPGKTGTDKESLMDKEELIKKSKELQSIESTTDVTLYGRAVQNNILRRSFMRALQEGSIDCVEHYGTENDKRASANTGNRKSTQRISEIKCRMCLPTGRPLYVSELRKDMRLPTPCESIDKEKIKTKSILIERKNEDGDVVAEKEYMYNIEDGTLHIFEFDKRLNGYVEIFSNNPDYYDIYKIIKEKEKKIM